MVIPRIQFNIKYIEKELDEEDREDFFRLKRVTDKKKIEKAAALYEAEKAGIKMKGGEEQESDSIFGAGTQEDEDVVF